MKFKKYIILILLVLFMKVDAKEIGKPYITQNHTSELYDIELSSDGKYLITSGAGIVNLWDFNTKKQIRTLKLDFMYEIVISISPDNNYIVILNRSSGFLQIWNAETGKKIKNVNLDNKYINSITFSKNGNFLIAKSYLSTTIYSFKSILKAANNEQIKEINGSIDSINDNFVLFNEIDSFYLYNINYKSNKFILESIYKDSGIGSKESAIDPTGKHIVTVIDNKVTLWDRKSQQKIKTFLDTTNFKYSSRQISFSPDGNNIILFNEKKIHIWNVINQEIKALNGKFKSIPDPTFTPNGKYLIIKSDYNEFKVIELQSMKEIKKLKNIKSLTITPDSRFIIFSDNRLGIKKFDLKKLTTGYFLKYNKPKGIKTLKFSKENNNLIFSTKNSLFSLKLKNTTLDSIFSINKGQKRFTLTTITADKKNILIGVGDEIEIWNTKKNKKVKSLQSESVIKKLSLSQNDKYLLSYDESKNFILWDLLKGTKLKVIKNKDKSVKKMTFTKNNNRFIIATDKSINIWDLSNIHKPVFTKNKKISDVSFSPNGKYALIGNFRTIEIVDLEKNKIIFSEIENNVYNCALAFTHDSKYAIFQSSSNNELVLFDLKKIKKIKKFKSNSDFFRVKVSPDNKFLISYNFDNSLKIWNLNSAKELLSFHFFDNNEWIMMTPEGYFNATPNAAKYLNILTDPMEASSIDAFYEQFYRPDIVAKSLESTDDNTKYDYSEPKLKLSEIKPAPNINIVKTASNIDKEELKVTLKITPKQKDEYGQIRLYLNGTLIKTDNDRALKIKKKENNSIYKTYTLKIPKGEHTIKALVFNKNNTMQSRDALHTVTSTYNPIVKPNIYAVIVGINDYKNPTLTLKYAVPDAKLFADTIKDKTKGLFGKVDVKLLTTKSDTTKENITKTLKSLQNLNPQDMFIFYVASHGMVEDAKYHMITSNVGALSARKIKQEAISQESLKELVANIPTTKKFIILDTCNSGALGKELEVALLTRGLSETTAMKVLSRAVGSTIISASSSTQEALEGYKGHGLLTYVLTQGLKGKADSDNDGFVKTLEISNYVEDEVPEIADKVFKRAQYPYVSPLGQGFPLVKVK